MEPQWCRQWDLNPYEIAPTSPSSWRVCHSTITALVMRPGIEPGNSTLKGWRLYQFVQRTKLFVPRNQLVQIIRRICGGNLFKTTSNNLPKRMLFLLSVLTDLKFHTTLCCTVNPKSIFSYWNLSNNFLFTGLIFCQCFPWHSNSPLVMPVGIEPTTSSLRGW